MDLNAALFPALTGFSKYICEGLGDRPRRVVSGALGEITNITDMVPLAAFVRVFVGHFAPGDTAGDVERLQNGTAIRTAAAEIIDFTTTRSGDEFLDKACDVVRVDVISHLLPFVAKDRIFPPFQIASYQIANEPMELYAGMIRSGQATAAQAASVHPKVAAILLYHDVRGDLRRSEKRVLGLIDTEVLLNPVEMALLRVVPTGVEFPQRDLVWRVTVHFVCGHVNERRFRACSPRRFQKIQSSYRVRVEVIIRDRGGTIVARLSCSVNDGVRPECVDEIQDTVPVANIEFMMLETRKVVLQPALVPARISLWPEKDRTLIVVQAMDFPPCPREVGANFGSDEAGRTGNQ